MSVVFERGAGQVEQQIKGKQDDDITELLRPLDHRARRVLGLFSHQAIIRSSDVANLLGISTRQTRELLRQWVDQGWLVVTDPSRRGRKYELANEYHQVISK